MTSTTISGQIKEGKLTISNRKRLESDCSEFPDCDVDIIIKKKGKRSSLQNAYYWGVVIEEIRRAFKRNGDIYNAEDIHAGLKAKFNPQKACTREGEVLLEIGGSTTEMNKGEFSEYIERIIVWAAKGLEIAIPAPGDQTDLFNSKAA